MYYPYLRGKQFELQSLENVSPGVYANTMPIIEPVTSPKAYAANKSYKQLAALSIPMILIVNPEAGGLDEATVRARFLGDLLAAHNNLTLGFIVAQTTTHTALRAFLLANPAIPKAVIFKSNFIPAQLTQLVNVVRANPPARLIFEARLTSHVTQDAFAWHQHRALVSDGFQAKNRNKDYPPSSVFASDYNTYRASGWQGIGDYQTIGEKYKSDGGPARVVTLHITRDAGAALMTQHYSSVTDPDDTGDVPLKFMEACDALVASPFVAPLTSTGLDMYRGWQHTRFFPNLGPAKQASIQHHIELLSGLI